MRLGYGTIVIWIAAVALAGASVATAQTTYQPKFNGDPARSESEAAALGYMRTVLRAQKEYQKKNDKYAASLADSGAHRFLYPAHGEPGTGRLHGWFPVPQRRFPIDNDAQAARRPAPLLL